MNTFFVYAAIGADFKQYSVNMIDGSLSQRSAITLPAGLQYAWRHASKPILYAACSDGGPGNAGTQHFVCALTIHTDGSLKLAGVPTPLRSRPVHLASDRTSQHLLLAYNAPSALSVHRIKRDGSIGEEIKQKTVDLGACAHQITVTPDNHRVVLPVRGNDPEHGNLELPGSIEIFDYSEGILTHRQ